MEAETEKQREERLEKLWKTLDSRGDGQIDINGLKKGLKRLDHRMAETGSKKAKLTKTAALKNADTLLHEVLKAVDTSGDGQIQYNGKLVKSPNCGILFGSCYLPEFRVFVKHTERELFQLFESIDHDRNGELDKGELKLAFKRAGLAISNAKLDQFFNEVDANNDGAISFEEWR